MITKMPQQSQPLRIGPVTDQAIQTRLPMRKPRVYHVPITIRALQPIRVQGRAVRLERMASE